MSGIGLSPQLVDRAFPFHVAFRADGRVLQVGSVLQRLCPALSGGVIGDTFKIVRPQPMPFEFELIRHHPRTVFVLQMLGGTLKLKGQMTLMEDEVMVFLGSPWITELTELAALNLQLGDFSVHDQVVDCLFLIQSQQTALADVRRLASQQSVKLAQQQSALLEAERLARERLEDRLADTAVGAGDQGGASGQIHSPECGV